MKNLGLASSRCGFDCFVDVASLVRCKCTGKCGKSNQVELPASCHVTELTNMAEEREPPPMFGEENYENDPDSDDLFKSASDNQSKTTASTFEDVDVQDDDDKEDIFADAKTEVPLDSPEEPASSNPFASEWSLQLYLL